MRLTLTCLLLLGLTGLMPQPSASLTGQWHGCLRMGYYTVEVCGDITIGAEQAPGREPPFYLLTHSLDLSRIDRRGYLTEHGSIVTRPDSSQFIFWLGTPEGSRYGTDGGWILGDLQLAGDSLFGEWSRTCFGGCPERGQIVLRRVP